MKSEANLENNENGCFLPDFCNIRTTFAVVIAAELMAVVLSIAGTSSVDWFWSRLSMLSLYIQWVALGSSASLCLLKPLLRQMSAGLSGLTALLILLVITAVTAHLGHTVFMTGDGHLPYQTFILQSLAISFIIGVLSLHYFYMQFRLNRQQEAEAEARFQALQARIRPHFLFNSMNTIAHLTRADPELAESVVENLADLFRATLDEPGKVSSIGEEIELARGYLNIESLRLGDRLQVDWHLDESLMTLKMPSMMLQPLLENAVYHGIETTAQGGRITVSTRQDSNAVALIIENTVHPGQKTQRNGNRMAQENIRQRLMSFYGDTAGFDIDETDEHYRIQMSFPSGQ